MAVVALLFGLGIASGVFFVLLLSQVLGQKVVVVVIMFEAVRGRAIVAALFTAVVAVFFAAVVAAFFAAVSTSNSRVLTKFNW